jgi:Ca2+-binding RTX toxin-like protein
MAAKQNQSKEDLIKDLIKDRTFMRRVAHGYDMQIAPGAWLHGAFLAEGQDRFIVDAAQLQAGIGAALGSLTSQDDANFAAAALLRLKTAGVDIGGAQLSQALAGSPYALTLLAAIDADVTDFASVKWLQSAGIASAAAGTDAAFLLGSSGADRLTGSAGGDTLAGNRGDDRLEGGAGSDTYLFSAGDGHDTIGDSAGATDTIRFGAGITPDMVGFRRVGQDLVLGFEGSGDQITIAGWGTGAANQVERVEFADGTVWDAGMLADFVSLTAPAGTAGADTLQGWDGASDILRGGAGDDALYGGGGDDVLFGGSGNDILAGGTGTDDLVGALGADVYLFKRGDGQDTIYDHGRDRNGADSSIDTLRFGAGISAGDIVLRRESTGLVFAIAGSGDRITVSDWAWGDDNRIERVEFADGTVWQAADLQERIAASPYSSGAGDGDDFVGGWAGFDDTLQGFGGDDTLIGDSGNDILEGGAGNDWLQGGGGSNTYRFARGDGMDTIYDYDYDGGDGTIVFGPGIAEGDIVMARSGNDVVIRIKDSSDQITISGWGVSPSSGIERFAFADGTAWDAARLAATVAALDIVGTDGADYLYGNAAGNTLVGGAGDDYLAGGGGNDVYRFARGDGHDIIEEFGYTYGDVDTLRFGAGIGAADIVLSRSGNDLVLALAGSDDRITVRNWTYGDYNRIEQVAFADGTVWDAAALAAMVSALPFVGTDGDDRLTGDDGANTFDGGGGNDILLGGNGDDTYLFERGDGHDTIQEWEWYGIANSDTIRFGAGIAAADVVLRRSGDGIVFELAGGNDSVTVQSWAYGRVEQVAFADGTVWDAAALADMVAAAPVLGTEGDDTLAGDESANIIDGGAGNDTLRGGGGGDTYLFARGDGQDTIEEFGYGVDTIRFGADIGAGDIVLSRSGNDLVLALDGSDDRITVRYWQSGDWNRVEQVAFADGTMWDATALAAMVAALPFVGTDGDDRLTGGDGADTFDGGAGNDTLLGGYGGDTYLFERGDGQDSIEEGSYAYGEVDTIRFGAGIGAGDIVLSRSGNDLVLALGGSDDRVTVRNWSYGDYYRIEKVAFADGSAWDAAALGAMVAALPIAGTDGNDYLSGDDGANTFDGGAGNDTLQGGSGADTYLFERGDGQDSIDEGGYGYGEVDTIRFGAGIGAGDIVLSRSGNDLVLALAGSDDRVTVRNWNYGDYYRIERVAFADGSAWDAAALAAMVAAIPLTGTDGNDVLNGDNGANTFDGGAGNDTLQGGYGADTYLFERGDGQDSIEENGYDLDTIRFGAGIAAGDIVLSRSGNDLVLALAGSDERVTVRNWSYGDYYRIEQVAFADGTVWDASSLAAMVAAIPVTGTDGDDYLGGDDSANTFDGGAGNDTLRGGYGADTYLFERGDGQDSIEENGYDLDTIRFGAGIAAANIVVSREGADLVFAVAGTDDRITVRNWRYDNAYRIEQVAFADGTVWDAAALRALAAVPIIGSDGDDYLSGDSDDNLLDGGAGNDTLRGGSGGDTYVFERGDGQDTIEEDSYGGIDTLRFGAGIGAGDIVLSRSGNDLVFSLADAGAGAGDRVTVRNWRYGDPYRIEQVAFDDGTVWDAAALGGMFQALPLAGTDGNDYLSGDDSANTFDGGAGNDTLQGGYGGDTYLFERGDGQDSIDESGYDVDTIRFGAGIGAADIVVSRSGTDLVFAVAGSDDRVTVRNWSYGDYYRIEQVAFADGTVWDAAALKALASPPIIGTDGDDYLSGDSEDNLLDGGAGNDVLQGSYGADTYVFERGDGQDSIDENGYDLDTIRFGAGIGAADIVVSRSGNDLVFEVAGSEDKVTVRNWRYGDYYRIEQVAFADGTVWDAAALRTLANVPLIGTDGDDFLGGDSDDNLFDGGAGNDTLQGEYGADTYLFERGDGQDRIYEYGYDLDTIRFGAGIAAADIVVSREGGDLVFAVAGTEDRIAVANWQDGAYYRIERIEFADGTAWDAAQLDSMTAGLPIAGTARDDSLYGDDGDNVLVGGAGNDYLNGGAGGDTYVFGRGDGQDLLLDYGYDPARPDVIRFGEGILDADISVSRSGSSLVFGMRDSSDRVEVMNWEYGDTYRIERVEFADGTTWDAATIEARIEPLRLVGSDGDDYLAGDALGDVLIGGAGNDLLEGGAGDDVYVYELGDGNDTIFDADYNDGNVDTLRLGAGVTPGDVAVSRSGTDLVLTIGATGEAITVAMFGEGAAFAIERVEFDDGTTWSSAGLVQRLAAEPIAGTVQDDLLLGWDGIDDTLVGAEGTDLAYGNAGADTLDGGMGNDLLDAGSGDDVLLGGEGSDLLVGGAGNDTIDTGEGNDVILFKRGDGQDSVRASAGADNTISLGGGIGAADLLFSKTGNDLVLSAGGIEQITFLDWYAGEGNRSIANLQLVSEGGAVDPATGMLPAATIAQFDFGGLVGKFDEARLADPGLGAWALSSSLLEFSLYDGSDAALGGELGVRYGLGGDVLTYPGDSAHAMLASPEFGKTRQAV